MTSALCVTVPRPGSEAALHREPPSGWVLIVLSCSGLRVHPGFFHPDTALCLQPLGPQWGHSRLRSHLPCVGFYAVSAVGPHCSAPGGSSSSCCCPRCFQSLHRQLSGLPSHPRTYCPTCGLETLRGTTTPTTCLCGGSGGTPAPRTCSGCGRASAQVGCGNKGNPV